jgi:tRNA 2-thiouridine synthesizing protein A
MRVTPPQENATPAPRAAPSLTIDALGRKCPIPVILLAERIREVPAGELIELLADDPVAQTDLPAWCVLKSHELVCQDDRPEGWSFLVRRIH